MGSHRPKRSNPRILFVCGTLDRPQRFRIANVTSESGNDLSNELPLTLNDRYRNVNWYRHHLHDLRTVDRSATRDPGGPDVPRDA